VIGDFLWSLWELLRNAVVYYMRASSATAGRYRTSPEGSRRAHGQLLRYAQLVDEVSEAACRATAPLGNLQVGPPCMNTI